MSILLITANTPYYAMLQFNFDGVDGGVTGWLNGTLIDTLARSRKTICT